MRVLGLGDRIREIDAIREAVAAELKVLDEVLAASSKAERRRGRYLPAIADRISILIAIFIMVGVEAKFKPCRHRPLDMSSLCPHVERCRIYLILRPRQGLTRETRLL